MFTFIAYLHVHLGSQQGYQEQAQAAMIVKDWQAVYWQVEYMMGE